MANYSDNFDRANSTTIGGNWVEINGDWEILSNHLHVLTVGASGQDRVHNTGVPSSADYSVQETVTHTGTTGSHWLGVMGRFDGTNTYYTLIYLETGDLKLYYINAGTFNQLGSTYSNTPSGGTAFTLKLTMTGDQISGYLDGVLRIGPITDGNITVAGTAGTSADGDNTPAGDFVDDFSMIESGSASASASLSPSYSSSASVSPSSSASRSVSASASSSSSRSLSPSTSASASGSASESASASASASKSLSPSSSASASGSASESASASASPSPAEYTNKYSTTGNTYTDKYTSTL